MKILKPFAPLFIASSLLSAQQLKPMVPVTPDELGIDVSGTSREIAYTNKNTGVFYSETGAEHRTGWQGWRVDSKEMLEDYRVVIGGIPLLKKDVKKTVVYPHQLKRFYANGVEETVTLLDSMNALVVELDNIRQPEVAMYPLFSDDKNEDDYDLGFNKDILTMVHKNHPVRTEGENYPAAISVSFVKENLWTGGFYDSTSIGKNFSPAYTKTVNPIAKHTVVFTIGDSAYHAITLMKFVAKNVDSLLNVRKLRLERLVNGSLVRTDAPRLDAALNWAKVSMDALIMNQTGKGIFAGLPWFDNYWGRDTYISLPGATLVCGKFSEARDILTTFAAAQDTSPAHSTYGRIPNQITTMSTSYNTADGTPRFTIALEEYYDYSGDKSTIDKLYPAVKRGIDGTLKYHTDDLQFLTHGDAETWMDAAGPNGSWSPRGNRANDIQGLWYRQLMAGARMAEIVGDGPNVAAWRSVAATVRENYQKYFVDPATRLAADHLKSDGTAVRDMRPNQMFADELLDEPLQREMFTAVTNALVYPHGVASLAQTDPEFHPYHHYLPYYVQDAAYHNGVVWTWLYGKWIDLAARFGAMRMAEPVIFGMTAQILDSGAVGTISELLDAAPRPGEKGPRRSGAFSQAWSLAEFIRSYYQDILGITITSEQGKTFVTLTPNLPDSVSRASARVRAGDAYLQIDYARTAAGMTVNMGLDSGSTGDIGYRFYTSVEGKKAEATAGVVSPGKVATFVIPNSPSGSSGPLLATPEVRSNLKALTKPPYRMLTNKEVKNSLTGNELLDVADPVHDDNGNGKYTYPLTPSLKPGSLDITHFTVSADAKNVHFTLAFRELSNPGWHPEYGFQLTYAAIAIDKDGKENSGQSKVGMNANYTFGKSFRFENIVYVGGGISVEDAKGKTLAIYSPVEGDEGNPIGDPGSRTVEFSIPTEILGLPTASWRFAVLVGAQDDHGGAGIGEFRSVEAKQSEWAGGGRKNASDSNVFDVLLPKR